MNNLYYSVTEITEYWTHLDCLYMLILKTVMCYVHSSTLYGKSPNLISAIVYSDDMYTYWDLSCRQI